MADEDIGTTRLSEPSRRTAPVERTAAVPTPLDLENRVKLYSLLVDQLHRYNSVIWQAPTALLAANILANDRLRSQPAFLFGVVALNAAVIFAFFKMIVQQTRIITAAKSAEAEIRESYPAYVPQFPPKSRVRAPQLMLWVLVLLDALLFWSVLRAVSWSEFVTAFR